MNFNFVVVNRQGSAARKTSVAIDSQNVRPSYVAKNYSDRVRVENISFVVGVDPLQAVQESGRNFLQAFNIGEVD